MKKRLEIDIDGAAIPSAWMVEQMKRAEIEKRLRDEAARSLYVAVKRCSECGYSICECEPIVKRGVAVWEV